MVIVDEGILRRFSRKHNQAKKPLDSWLRTVGRANWRHLMDVKCNYPTTDGGVKGAGYTIFNIKGNSYRLVTVIDYADQTVLVTNVFTHAEYDKWNKS